MMKQTLFAVFLSVCISVSVVFLILPAGSSPSIPTTTKESVYDRVMRTGTIRCGYGLWPPALMKDPNTGQLSGIYYDYLEALGKELGLKIDWSLELSMETYLQDLKMGRVDLECSGGWPNATRGKFADYTVPIYYNPVYMYARKGFKTDPNHLTDLNRPDVRFSVMEGETAQVYRTKLWPQTTAVTTPGNAPILDYVTALKYGKADVTLCDQMSITPYMKQNPDVIYRVSDTPVFFIANNMTVAPDETRFLNMLNTATQQMLYSGDIERILQKYKVDRVEALRVAVPYQAP